MCPAWRAVSSVIPISTRRNDTCSPNHAGAQVLQVLFVDHLIGGCASPAVEGDDVCSCLSGASAHVVDRVGFERLCFTSVGLTEPLVLPTPARCFTKPYRWCLMESWDGGAVRRPAPRSSTGPRTPQQPLHLHRGRVLLAHDLDQRGAPETKTFSLMALVFMGLLAGLTSDHASHPARPLQIVTESRLRHSQSEDRDDEVHDATSAHPRLNLDRQPSSPQTPPCVSGFPQKQSSRAVLQHVQIHAFVELFSP
jgi:hypothetical protein